MNRRQLLGAALGGIVAAVVGAKAEAGAKLDAAMPALPTFAEWLVAHPVPPFCADSPPQRGEWMDTDGLIHGPGYQRRIIVRTGTVDGCYTMAAWVPGLVERLPTGYTTSDVPIDGNHFGVQFAHPRKNMQCVVLLDGIRTRGVTEAYAGDYGWVIRNVPEPNGESAFLDEGGLSVVQERVFGAVAVLPSPTPRPADRRTFRCAVAPDRGRYMHRTTSRTVRRGIRASRDATS